MKVLFAKRALNDLQSAVSYLVQHDNERSAAQLIEDVLNLAERLATEEFEGP